MPVRPRWIAAGVVALLACGVVIASGAFVDKQVDNDVPTATVSRGEYRKTHVEAGELRAARDEKIVSPRVRGDLKIVHLWPEGEQVEVGDLILQFDRTQHAQDVKDRAGELEQAKADLTKSEAEQRRRYSDLQMQVEQKKASLELARISAQKSEYGSPIELEEARISVQQAERALTEAGTNLEAQEIIDRVERANRELRISHRQKNYDRALSDYERLSVYAARPGILVYEVIRKRGANRRGKVMEGDIVWGGTSLLALPELDSMQVVTQVGEMDVHTVEVGQPALIRLEAFPGPVFGGVVRDIAPMASELEDAPNVSVFEMIVDIEGRDDRLYPGMSASVEVITSAMDSVLTLPVAAVHERDGRTVVYRQSGRGFEAVEVVVADQNGLDVVIGEGLSEGDVVSLSDLGLL
jgi:multidrug efflux pump subunit AcrA (membrane-fusion protein)